MCLGSHDYCCFVLLGVRVRLTGSFLEIYFVSDSFFIVCKWMFSCTYVRSSKVVRKKFSRSLIRDQRAQCSAGAFTPLCRIEVDMLWYSTAESLK